MPEHHDWEKWDLELKQACLKLPECLAESQAAASFWDAHVGLHQLAYHLRDQLWFCCQRLSEARRDITCLESSAADMQNRASDQAKIISDQKLAEDRSARTLKRLQHSLDVSDRTARQAIGELQQRCTILQGERDDNAEKLRMSQEHVQELVRAKEDAQQCVTSLQSEQLRQQHIQQEMASELALQKDAIAQALKLREQYATACHDADGLIAENAELRRVITEVAQQQAAAAAPGACRSSSPQARLQALAHSQDSPASVHFVTMSGDLLPGRASSSPCLQGHADRAGHLQRPHGRCPASGRATSPPTHLKPRPASAQLRSQALPADCRRQATAGAPSKPSGATAGAWLPKEASSLVQQFLADWASLYGGAAGMCAGCGGGVAGPLNAEQVLSRKRAADALVLMLNRVFLRREDARVGALKARHRQRLKDLHRRQEQQRGLAECVELQRAAWGRQLQKERPKGRAGGCQKVLAASMGKSFAATRELEKVAIEKAELQEALAATSEALQSAKGAWEQGAAWERCQLVPALQQHDAALKSCASQLLGIAGEAGSKTDTGQSEGGSATDVVQRVMRSLVAVRQDLRELWQELLGEQAEAPTEESGGAHLLTPALLQSRAPAGRHEGQSLESEV